MRRRTFIAALGGVAAWPVVTQAEPTTPLVGYLSGAPRDADANRLRAFLQGLRETGYVEGQNVAIEYRWGDGQFDKFPGLAADLVRSKVDVIATIGGIPLALAAKSATSTIPIVFGIGADPVEAGLVASLNRPGGNMTGVTAIGSDLFAKRVELLHELAPKESVIALLVNPSDGGADAETRAARNGARSLGLQLHVLRASTTDEIDSAFRKLAELRARGLMVSASVFFSIRREQIVAQAAQNSVPTIYPWRESTTAGGLMSYGANLLDNYRLVGVYTGKILHGAKAADLPVEQAVKVELIVNLKTARALGLTLPPDILARADEVIE
jgi:putative ABC transport system substrate-binding protein